MFPFFANILSPISNRTIKSCPIPSIFESANLRSARHELCKCLSGICQEKPAGLACYEGKTRQRVRDSNPVY